MPQLSKTAKFKKLKSKDTTKTKVTKAKPTASQKKVKTTGKLKPAKAKRNKPPVRKRNQTLRTREYLSTHEITALRQSAKLGRNGHRNELLILMLFRHALRVSEAIALKWEQVDSKLGLLHVKRIKNGTASTHPLGGAELRALRQLRRERSDAPYIFISERKAPLTARTVQHIVTQAGIGANLSLSVHPHMLRHSTGFYLANKGVDTRAIQSYMGHANIKNTVIYTELSPKRFNGFWDD